MFTIVVGPALQSFFSEGNLARSVNFLCLIILLCVSVSFPLHKTDEVPYPLGKSCHIWQFLKVSIELRTLAVLWTLFCVDRTADLSSFMDTFSMFTKLPDLGSFMDTFQTQ